MKVQTYNDMTVEVMQATPYPAEVVGLALSLTMKARGDEDIKPLTLQLAEFLIDAEHMSPLEHVVYTFLIQGVSRSFLAQITRHRTGSFTSGSQHYQLYSDYPGAIHPALESYTVAGAALDTAMQSYIYLMEDGVPKEEARQVLPNAATVSLLWTVDARNLFFFLRQRCCNRNVTEMRIFANRVRVLAIEHFPELFNLSGPQCFQGVCMQKHMQCDQASWDNIANTDEEVPSKNAKWKDE